MNLVQVGQPSYITSDGSFVNPATFKLGVGASLQQQYQLILDSIGTGAQININGYDTDTDNDAGWLTFAADISGSPGSYSAQLVFNTDTSPVYFWAKATVPIGTTAQMKRDLRIAILSTTQLVRVTQIFNEALVSQPVIVNSRITQIFNEVLVSA